MPRKCKEEEVAHSTGLGRRQLQFFYSEDNNKPESKEVYRVSSSRINECCSVGHML